MTSALKKILSFRTALLIVILLNSAVIVFHLLVMFQIIPFTVVWAGRLKTVDEMYAFETVSIILNVMLVALAVVKASAIRREQPLRVADIFLWFFVIMFVFNTVGNLTAVTTVETYIATPLTFILAVCCARLAVESVSPNSNGSASAV